MDGGATGPNDGGMTTFKLSEAQQEEVRAAARRAAGVPLAELTRSRFRCRRGVLLLRRLAREVTGGAGFALLRGVRVDPDPDLGLRRSGQLCRADRAAGPGTRARSACQGSGRGPGLPTTRSYQHSAALGYHADPTGIVALLCIRPAKSGGLSTSCGRQRCTTNSRGPGRT